MPVIKLRGLPWSCTPDDIVKFLGDEVNIVSIKNEADEEGGGDNTQESQESQQQEDGTKGHKTTYSIVITTNAEGRPSGEAFIELVDEADVETALRKNNAMMGQRYIEIFRSSVEQMRRFTAESNESAKQWRDPVVRLRGLPYGCTKKDVHDFFGGSIIFESTLF
jgi:heterogeneous nuclear ribonucleoprotein F/H